MGPLLWNLVPVYGQWKLLREKPDQADGLTALRFIFIGLVVSLFLFLVVLSFIVPWNGSGDAKWLLPAIAVVAAIGLARVRAARNRPLKIESRERLAGSYRANRFLGVGYSEAPAAFFGAVFVGKLWLYLVGLTSALVGLALIAPTRADIERRQQQIAAQGSSLSLLEALMSPPSQDSGGDPS